MNEIGVHVSRQAIRNRLHDAGMRSPRPAIFIPLTPCHIQERFKWAQTPVTWTVDDWSSFVTPRADCASFTLSNSQKKKTSNLNRTKSKFALGLVDAQFYDIFLRRMLSTCSYPNILAGISCNF